MWLVFLLVVTLKNMKNNLYVQFSIKTNIALICVEIGLSLCVPQHQITAHLPKMLTN